MLAGIRKRLARRQLDIKECEDDDKDDLHFKATISPTKSPTSSSSASSASAGTATTTAVANTAAAAAAATTASSNFMPPATNYIKISQGKIQLVNQPPAAAATTANGSTVAAATANVPNKSATVAAGVVATSAQPKVLSPTSVITTLPPYSYGPHKKLQQHLQLQQHQQQLQQQQQQLQSLASPKDNIENRIKELEAGLMNLKERVNNSQCGSPTFEKELRQQMENMSRVIKSKDRKQLQTCRDHKALQTRFARQENLLHALQQENKALLMRVRQYEHCLDDVMRKVVDAIVAEDNLREEVSLLKSRVRDLEAQNAALSSASPAKGRDEGYCTMSSGQPQPSNGHLEDLPEEPEQWLLPAEPCSTEMEDWSMSQEELAVITTLDDDRDREQNNQLKRQQQQQQLQQQLQHQKLISNGVGAADHDWIWNSSDLLNSTMVETDSVTDSISQLLQQKIIYSEDEEVACTEFTNDFYKLVNIRSSSARSLYSYIEGDTDDEDDDDDEESSESSEDHDDMDQYDDGSCSLSASHKRLRSKVLKSRQKTRKDQQPPSPTPSEAGRAQVTSCSSSETDDFSHCTKNNTTTTATTTTTTTTATHPETQTHLLNTLKEQNEYEEEHHHQLTDHEQEHDDTLTTITTIEHDNDHDLQEHSDIEIEEVIQLEENGCSNSFKRQLSTADQQKMSEKECIEQIIRNELNRTPCHKLMKSQSTIEQRVTTDNSLKRLQQKQQSYARTNDDAAMNGTQSVVIRSGSVNGNLVNKFQHSQQQQLNSNLIHCNNSWRRSNGWKRVTTSPLHSPKRETSAKMPPPTNKSPPSPPAKITPSRIPSSCKSTAVPTTNITSNYLQNKLACNNMLQQQNTAVHQQQQQQLQPLRKSKIPPPVPIRRSYAS